MWEGHQRNLIQILKYGVVMHVRKVWNLLGQLSSVDYNIRTAQRSAVRANILNF
jgi:hypothetical protein